MNLFRETRVIENVILYVMFTNQNISFPLGETGFTFRFLIRETGLPRDIVRGFCRSLADQGLAKYMPSLWSEEGIPAGAGYGITQAGIDRIQHVLLAAA